MIKQSKVFMTGNWEDLIMVTFEVDKRVLEPYLPKNTALDLYNGKALMSMVTFTFSKVKFFGFKVPLHQKFGQINFRFYVKSKTTGDKGVVFIKEFAPKPLIAFVANTFYNEPYFYKNIKCIKSIKNKKQKVQYTYKGLKVTATSTNKTQPVKENTLKHFIVDRYIAFIKSKKNKTFQYKILHKPWKLYNTSSSYFNEEFLNLLPFKVKKAKHISTLFVDGSSVEVEKGILQNCTINNKPEHVLLDLISN